MSKRTIVIGAAVVALLPFLATPAAHAETRTLRGTIDGNPGSRLIIKVQRVGGDPFVIKSFAFKRVAFTCFGSAPSGRIGGTVVRMKVRKDVNPFDPTKRTNVYTSSTSKPREATEDGQIGVFITGIINRKGTRTSGNFGMSFGDGCLENAVDGFSTFVARG